MHPSKTEDVFRHGTFVHDFVRRHHLRAADGEPSFEHVLRPLPCRWPAQPAAGLPYSEFSQMMENEQPVASGATELRPQHTPRISLTEPAMPEFTLRASAGPTPRLDFSARRSKAARGPPPSGKLAPARHARRVSTGRHPCAGSRPPEFSVIRAAVGADPRELHHRGRTRWAVDHRPACGPRMDSVRAGAQTARRRKSGTDNCGC